MKNQIDLGKSIKQQIRGIGNLQKQEFYEKRCLDFIPTSVYRPLGNNLYDQLQRQIHSNVKSALETTYATRAATKK